MSDDTAQPVYSSDTCMICREPLVIPYDDDYEGPSYVTDDVELYCGSPGSGPSGHHAHWVCLLDWAMENEDGRDRCPLCGQNTLNASDRLIVDVKNEGGATDGFDFGEVVDEEIFLKRNPEQENKRVFHDLIAQGQFDDAAKLVFENGVDVNCTYGSEGLTALQKAMFCGDARGAEFLQSLGATR